MKRRVGALMLAAAMGGCMSSNHGPASSGEPTVRASGQYLPQNVPGVTGAWGEPIAMTAPYTSSPPVSAAKARHMMAQSVPLSWVNMDQNIVQASAQMPQGGMPPMMPPGMMAPPGMPMSPGMMPPGGGMMPPGGGMMMPPPNMPPSNGGNSMLVPRMPGALPGMAPPGSLPYGPGAQYPGGMRPPGAVAALGAIGGAGGMQGGPGYKVGRTQVRFSKPAGMKVAWLTQNPDGKPGYSAPIIEAPGRYNFTQASIYGLKLSAIEGRPGLEIYPTLEVVPSNPKTDAFLAHSAVPIEFTAQDFQEVVDGKYVVKVIYLPDPQYQELATAGTDEVVSTRLEPGADPIMEAQRRGCILLVIRMGNVDQEAPNTPPLQGPQPNNPMAGMMPPPGMMPPGLAGPGGLGSPTVPPDLRAGPGGAVMPLPSGGPGGAALPLPNGPAPAAPAAPAIPVPPSPTLPNGSLLKAPDAAPLRPASTMPALPPGPPQSSVSLPPMPPSPAELATQGGATKK